MNKLKNKKERVEYGTPNEKFARLVLKLGVEESVTTRLYSLIDGFDSLHTGLCEEQRLIEEYVPGCVEPLKEVFKHFDTALSVLRSVSFTLRNESELLAISRSRMDKTITLKKEDLEALVRYCYDLENGIQGIRQREKLCDEIQAIYQETLLDALESDYLDDDNQ